MIEYCNLTLGQIEGKHAAHREGLARNSIVPHLPDQAQTWAARYGDEAIGVQTVALTTSPRPRLRQRKAIDEHR